MNISTNWVVEGWRITTADVLLVLQRSSNLLSLMAVLLFAKMTIFQYMLTYRVTFRMSYGWRRGMNFIVLFVIKYGPQFLILKTVASHAGLDMEDILFPNPFGWICLGYVLLLDIIFFWTNSATNQPFAIIEVMGKRINITTKDIVFVSCAIMIGVVLIRYFKSFILPPGPS